MKIYIELVVIVALMIVFILWRLWFMWSKWRLKRKYKPENDKARKGGYFDQGTVRRTEQRIDTASDDTVRPEQSEGRQLFQTTTVSDVREDSHITRKNSSGLGKLLRRTRKE